MQKAALALEQMQNAADSTVRDDFEG